MPSYDGGRSRGGFEQDDVHSGPGNDSNMPLPNVDHSLRLHFHTKVNERSLWGLSVSTKELIEGEAAT
eukprot:CAMPEP_0175882048 /NCGR_PEP_ID=MMETSP0107_2-20121207/43197_1 /TAXON_ID=195067 ORGANISM="Goniomonas pacifica, Strain CCMP1869" /NCGR_SAMPLE_ID=MMETSP0107_2 /ASSEMBLY_ACC=CAM_ASM_000203 /LENGTH=67 /DNA_ID=CAMNT_0017201941 /DNA_START=21 /DNA_END=224 /DNA_ORIENTATION=+